MKIHLDHAYNAMLTMLFDFTSIQITKEEQEMTRLNNSFGQEGTIVSEKE